MTTQRVVCSGLWRVRRDASVSQRRYRNNGLSPRSSHRPAFSGEAQAALSWTVTST